MPWVDDFTRWEYTWGNVRAALGVFTALQQLAQEDPCSMAACAYYDLLRALDGVHADQEQLEALDCQLSGMIDLQIGYVMGYTRVTVSAMLGPVRRAVAGYLTGEWARFEGGDL